MEKIQESTIRKVLAGKACAKEAEDVARWFSTDEGQAWLAEEIRRNPGFADIDDADIPSEEMLGEVLARVRKMAVKRRTRRLVWAVAASIVPALMLAGIWHELRTHLGEKPFGQTEMLSEHVRAGQKKEFIFQDGTKVYVNSASTITYPENFAYGKRVVRLDGEARFEVSGNPRRPFVVEAGDARIIVKGTVFNVKSFKDDRYTTVSLIKGSIDFQYRDQVFELNPSESVVLDKTSGSVTIDSTGALLGPDAWIDNVLTFKDAGARDFLESIARVYDVKFIVDDKAAYNCSITFTSDELSLPKLLTEIEMISPLSFKNSADGIHVRCR